MKGKEPMDYIINPSWIYWAHLLGDAKTLCVIVAVCSGLVRSCTIPSSCLTVMTNKLCDYEEAEEQGRLVPVVRCGECSFHEIADYGDGHTKNVCRLFSRQIQNDDYCSYGMRKEGDGNG
jgi:hypothetical protein